MIAGETELSDSDEMTKPAIAVVVPMQTPRVIPGGHFSPLPFEPACTGCAV
jgi:hypothetical protein